MSGNRRDVMRRLMEEGGFACRAEACEASEDRPRERDLNRAIGEVISRRLNRRSVMGGMLATGALAALKIPAAEAAPLGRFDFEEIARGVGEDHAVAPGYTADILIRWGDPVVPGAPAFDPENQTPEAQAQQFGYNNDYVAFIPLAPGREGAGRALLCVNHEYTNEEVIFPGIAPQGFGQPYDTLTDWQVGVEMAAHGVSVIEVSRDPQNRWSVVPESRFGRRITANGTPMRLSGPVAGHDRVKTKSDPAGRTVIGTINNCGGGMTPWGTYLTAEENFNGYFWGELAADHPEFANYDAYGIPSGWYGWGMFHDRFDVTKEPNEANRFGYIVEIDPMDPTSTPVKRTALGRFKHEGAETILNSDGRVVLYTGDDQRFEYVYKFVTSGRYDPADPAHNRTLLDKGTLFVARFDEDGRGAWLPLVWGTGPLTAENGFRSQADVILETRRAADLLGATPMDRPEDVEPDPVTGAVYVMLTNNTRRQEDDLNAANPRADNVYGHIIEMRPDEGDHGAQGFAWDILVRCGDPARPEFGAVWNPATTENGWFGMPDNCAVDGQGRLWVATDGNRFESSGTTDGIWALETRGALRGRGQYFYKVPVGAEMCGPVFTPDDRALFVAVQHPATDGVKEWPEFGRASTYEDPATRWPDFDPAMPPRPSVVVITKDDGGIIGG